MREKKETDENRKRQRISVIWRIKWRTILVHRDGSLSCNASDIRQMQSSQYEDRNPSLTIDRFAPHFPSVSLGDQAGSFTFDGVVNRDRDFTSTAIILNVPKAKALAFAILLFSSLSCVCQFSEPRLSSRTLSILGSPSCLSIRATVVRKWNFNLVRQTSVIRSLAVFLLRTHRVENGSGWLVRKRLETTSMQCCRYPWFNLSIATSQVFWRRYDYICKYNIRVPRRKLFFLRFFVFKYLFIYALICINKRINNLCL